MKAHGVVILSYAQSVANPCTARIISVCDLYTKREKSRKCGPTRQRLDCNLGCVAVPHHAFLAAGLRCRGYLVRTVRGTHMYCTYFGLFVYETREVQECGAKRQRLYCSLSCIVGPHHALLAEGARCRNSLVHTVYRVSVCLYARHEKCKNVARHGRGLIAALAVL